MRIEKQNIPANLKSKVNTRFRNHQSDIDGLSRKLTSFNSDRSALFGSRYTDDPEAGSDPHLEQRQQLLSGTDRLERSSGRLRESQRMALEAEETGRNTLQELGRQREVIVGTRDTLDRSEGFTDRSIKTLRSMARR
jgi:Snare region anchored in the vesicle membrane C-terminus/Vesicle transport v-SNARE protein N-terminus